jgi:hypothetical protein
MQNSMINIPETNNIHPKTDKADDNLNNMGDGS